MNGSRTADYDFDLPDDLIAQEPPAQRDDSRLMIVERAGGRITHGRFRDLATLPDAGDALVVNRTRVFRARLLGTRSSGGPAEVLLLKALGGGRWEAMVHPGGKLQAGRRVEVGEDLTVEVESVTTRRTRIVRLLTSLPEMEAIERHGHVPLPPYIHRPDALADAGRYQTVYAREAGSVAAPTAGLHFTEDLLGGLSRRGVRRVDVLLHVGAGTFRPVEVEDPAAHVMHEEAWAIDAASAATLNEVAAAGGRRWAVGSTVARTLESAIGPDGTFRESAGETRAFIRPPYRWQAIDRLLTNFHLPRSTLIMLVAAFAGYDLTMDAYRVAVREGYRFYSYGDAMVIL